ncbi:hypothetical protein H4R99_005057 [Coemansia sp. RSA 1722]|nr:hypothetical protein IWW45_007623 [Coemansia sp. RSA 485]KAJ2596118.1 hypothetical protein H4R99_005057 [Coemansia sp. RSA 1722]KAJ2602366.1 hypothetical protein GGF39_000730 [Coemansia sp. RSA 1721]
MDAMYSTPRVTATRQRGRVVGEKRRAAAAPPPPPLPLFGAGSNRHTPRILGRYTPASAVAAARSTLPVSPASSKSDAETDTDGESISEYPRNTHIHRQSARKPKHFVHRIERTGSHGISAEELESSSAAFRGYLGNSHEGSQDIALLLMLRNWHTMAQEARARRNQLHRHWGNATAFYKRSLINDVFTKWRLAANNAAEDEVSTYQKVQIALADMTRKNLLFRQVISRLVHLRDVANQINDYREDSSSDSNRYAYQMPGRARQNSVRRRQKQQQSQQAIRSTMSIITQNGVRQNSSLGRAMLKRIFSEWREAAAVNKSAELRADIFYRETSVMTVFGVFQTRWNIDCEMKDKADDHLRKCILRSCITRWNKTLHIRREQLLRYRAVQDIARRRDHKHRRMILLGWREVAEKIRHSEANASEFTAAKKKALLSMCINQYDAVSGPGEDMRAPEYVEHDYSECLKTCDRAISAQSSLAGPSVRNSASVEKLELLRRVREAEAQVDRYRSQWVDPSRAMLDLIKLDADLEKRLAIWEEFIRMKTYSFVLQRLRNTATASASQRQRHVFVGNAESNIHDLDDLDARERLFEKNNKHLVIEANFMRHHSPLKDTLTRWKGAMCLLADKHKQAVGFCYNMRLVSNRNLCSNVLSLLRDKLRNRRNLAMTAVRTHQKNVKKQFLFTFYKACVLQQMMDRAVRYNRKRILWNAYSKLVEVRFIRDMSRPRPAPEDTNGRVLLKDTLQGEIEHDEDQALIDETEPDLVSEATSDIDYTTDLDVLHECFSAWREVIDGFRNVQKDVFQRLNPIYRSRIENNMPDVRDFEWELAYQSQLIGQSFQIWRNAVQAKQAKRDHDEVEPFLDQPSEGAATDKDPLPILPAKAEAAAAATRAIEVGTDVVAELDVAAAADALDTNANANAKDLEDPQQEDMDEDGPNAEELRQHEAIIANSVARRACKAALHRLVLETRCQLFEKKLMGRRMNKLAASFTKRAKQAHVAREKARAFSIRSSVHNWSNSFFVHSLGLNNAAVQANGTLANTCLRHWIEQTRKRSAKKTARRMYTTAGAFRWEKQARRSLLVWMRASSDKRVQVRLAVKLVGDQKEQRLEEIASEWHDSKITKNAFIQMRMAIEQHLLLQRMQNRLATAWSEASSTRSALLTWRSRSSPTRSMFFSTGFEEQSVDLR